MATIVNDFTNVLSNDVRAVQPAPGPLLLVDVFVGLLVVALCMLSLRHHYALINLVYIAAAAAFYAFALRRWWTGSSAGSSTLLLRWALLLVAGLEIVHGLHSLASGKETSAVIQWLIACLAVYLASTNLGNLQ